MFPKFVEVNQKSMTHIYHIEGMTCSGCENKVRTGLAQTENVTQVKVSKENSEAIIEMSKHVALSVLQEALGGKASKYQISLPNANPKIEEKSSCCSMDNKSHNHQKQNHPAGKYYCPMHCEGDKVYDRAGDCPVCGMDLVEEQNLSAISSEQWTCPMHPEVVKDEAGSCPICGMDLVPMQPDLSAEEKTYKKLHLLTQKADDCKLW